MASFSRLEVLNEFIEIGLVPLFYNSDVDVVHSSSYRSLCYRWGKGI